MHRNQTIKVVCLYETNCGGETIATEYILKQLQKSKQYKIDSFYHQPYSPQDESLFGYLVWVVGSTFHWGKILLLGHYQLVYSPTFTAGVAAALLKRIKKLKLVFHYHGNRILPKSRDRVGLKTIIHCLRNGSYYRIHGLLLFSGRHYLSLWFHRLFLKSVDLLIVPSFSSKQSLRKQLLLNHNQIKIIPNGIEHNIFKPKQITSKRSRHTILYSGRIETNKGVFEILKTAQNLPEYQFIFAYPKPNDLYTYKKFCRYSDKLQNVRKYQEVSIKHLANLYQSSHLSLLPTKQDNLPMSYLESLACGTPVITTKVGELPQLQKSISTLLLIGSPKYQLLTKAIIQYFKLPSKYKKQLKKKCLNQAALFTWENTTNQLKYEFNQIIYKAG